jgi:saccharopine dehydrogenase (NAD+, L-lysine-forming)
VYLEEMELLPGEFPTLEETGFFYPGFNWFVDYIVIPLIYLNDGIFGGGFNDSLSKMLVWGLRQFTDPPYSGMVRLDAIGKIDGKIKQGGIKISHHDLHYMAAVPVVACLLQYLERKTRLPGIWYQASFVEPKRFFEDISRMGVTVEYNPPAGIVDKPIIEDEILSEVR